MNDHHLLGNVYEQIMQAEGLNEDEVTRKLFYPVDSRDPYKLLPEAQEARDLLAKQYIRGRLACIGGSRIEEISPVDVRATYFCAQGAVMHVQGHMHNTCHLIKALDKEAIEYGYVNVIAANDRGGRIPTLKVFDRVISKLRSEIILAEQYAASYTVPVQEPSEFTIPTREKELA